MKKKPSKHQAYLELAKIMEELFAKIGPKLTKGWNVFDGSPVDLGEPRDPGVRKPRRTEFQRVKTDRQHLEALVEEYRHPCTEYRKRQLDMKTRLNISRWYQKQADELRNNGPLKKAPQIPLDQMRFMWPRH